jgi:hypothetical protein
MSRQIIKKDNGKYAIWSSIVDDFIFDDITKEEYMEFRLAESKKEVKKDLEEIFDKIDNGKNVYYQFAMTYKDALAWKDRVHGKRSKK